MSKEQTAEPLQPIHPELPQIDWDASLAGIFRRAVDDLFTHQSIADAVQGREGEAAITRVLDQAKSGLLHHLEETAHLALINVVADLQRIRAREDQPDSNLPPTQSVGV